MGILPDIKENEIYDPEYIVKQVAKSVDGIKIITYRDKDFWLLWGWGETEDFMRTLLYTVTDREIVEKYYPDGYLKNGDLKDNTMFFDKVPEEIENALGSRGLSGVDFEDMLPTGEDYGFTDEFAECYRCHNVVRIMKNRGTADHFTTHEGVFCYKCVNQYENIKNIYIRYLISHNINDRPVRANTMLPEEQIREFGFIDLCEAEGNRNTCEFDTGLYASNNNHSPEEQVIKLQDKYDEILFDVTNSHPYEINWRIWVRNKKEDN